MRRLFLLVAAVVLVDTMFFAAVSPLLPEYADEFGLSKTGAGVLAAAYPAGFKDTKGYWVDYFDAYNILAYNTKLVPKEQAPKSWEDLLDPKWKRKFAIPNPGIHPQTLQFMLNLEKLFGRKWLAIVERWARQRPQVTRGWRAGTVQLRLPRGVVRLVTPLAATAPVPAS